MKDIKGDVRKFKEDSIGKDEVQSLVEEITAKFKNLKDTKDSKVSSLIEEDSNRGLNSLCENKHKSSVVFPEPFKGAFGENIFKFKKEIIAAIKDIS